MYTLDDYSAANAELAQLQQKQDNYSGNNPEKFRADIESMKVRLHLIETELKESGVLERTHAEIRDAKLDRAFPNAQSKQVVEWNGKKYIRRFRPVGKSISGKSVKEWSSFWEELPS